MIWSATSRAVSASPLLDRSDGGGDEQHAPRRDRYVGSQLLDDALRACHPPARLRHLAAQHQGERRPARAQRRPVGTTGTQVLGVGPLPGPDAVLVPPDQVRGHGEHLELVRVEVLSRVGEQRVHLEPRVPSERFPRSLHGANRRPVLWILPDPIVSDSEGP